MGLLLLLLLLLLLGGVCFQSLWLAFQPRQGGGLPSLDCGRRFVAKGPALSSWHVAKGPALSSLGSAAKGPPPIDRATEMQHNLCTVFVFRCPAQWWHARQCVQACVKTGRAPLVVGQRRFCITH